MYTDHTSNVIVQPRSLDTDACPSKSVRTKEEVSNAKDTAEGRDTEHVPVAVFKHEYST